MENNQEMDNREVVNKLGERGYTRLEFLKMIGAVAGAAVVPKGIPQLESRKSEKDQSVLSGFKKIEFPTLPFRRESMLVKGSDKPLSGKEIEKYFSEQNAENKPPYNVLTSEIIVGSEAWSRWNHGQSRSNLNQEPPANEKHILHYLKDHFVTIPQMVIDRTRPEACLRHIRMESSKHPTRVIIVDEDWLRENSQYGYGNMTTNVHSLSVHARYNFPASYDPSRSAYYQPRRGLDRGLMHEVSHQSMGLMPHYQNYFLAMGNWRTNIILPPSVTHDQMSLWHAREMEAEMYSGQLLNLIPQINRGDSLLSRPEEFAINRQINSGVFDSSGFDFSSNGHGSDDFAQNNIIIPSNFHSTEAVLHVARLKRVNGFDDFVWDFAGEGTRIDLLPSGTPLPNNLIRGGIVDADGNETGLPKAFILKVENKAFGFTSHHLALWHYLEQARSEQPYIGMNGPKKIVTITLGDF